MSWFAHFCPPPPGSGLATPDLEVFRGIQVFPEILAGKHCSRQLFDQSVFALWSPLKDGNCSIEVALVKSTTYNTCHQILQYFISYVFSVELNCSKN